MAIRWKPKEVRVERDRIIVELRDRRGLKFEQIAAQVGLKTNSVEEIYHKKKCEITN